MGFLDKLFNINLNGKTVKQDPNDPFKDFPAFSCSYIYTYLERWYEDDQKLSIFLSNLNLPVPEKVAPEPTFEYHEKFDFGCKDIGCKEHPPGWHRSISVLKPRYGALPPHFIFEIAPSNKFGYKRFGFVIGEEAIVERAKELYDNRDLLTLIKEIPIRWFSDDPYDYFKYLEKYQDFSHTIEEKHWTVGINTEGRLEGYSGPRIPHDFKEFPDWFTYDELRAVERRLNFYNLYCSGIFEEAHLTEFFLSKFYSYKREPFIPDSILFKLPLPEINFAVDSRVLKILPSPDNRQALAEQFFESLYSTTKHPISFELVSCDKTIYYQLVCAVSDAAHIKKQLKIHFRQYTIVEEGKEFAPGRPIYELTLSPTHSYDFLKLASDFTIDPYNQLFSVLVDSLPDDETITSVLFLPLQATHTALINYLEEFRAKESNSYYYDYDQAITERLRKFDKKYPGWLTQLRIVSTNEAVIERIKTAFTQQYETQTQKWEGGSIKFVEQLSRNLIEQNLVSTAELASLAHFPDKTVNCDHLETASMKSKLPPDSYTKDGNRIGTAEACGQVKPVCIPHSVRDRHVYIVGKSGTGKSTLLYNSIYQDIQNGSGVTIIDPHGDLVEDVLNCIPENRIEDTIYFNAGDKQHPIALNILNAQNEEEIGLLAEDLIVTFKRISESWGDRMDTILRYTFHTLLRVPNATLLSVASLLRNESYRREVLKDIDSPLLQEFWENQYPGYPKDAAQPILNRLAKFELSPTLSSILGQHDSSLNFFDVIQNRKILLVNLSKGIIGPDSAQLLGSIVVSQLQLAVMRRAALPKESRDPYYLYVDEFQNFITSAFEKILSEARKYKLCLTLAHQYISQLDEKTKNAILANVGTIVMFQSYPLDASALKPELGQYEPVDVTNMNTSLHEALCKPATQSRDTFKFRTLPPLKSEQSHAAAIISFTHENYCSEAPASTSLPHAVQEVNEAVASTPIRSQKLPAKALPKEFATAQDRILYYVSQAEYLSTLQIIRLCYAHLAESAKKSVASRDLKALVESKRIKSQMFGPGKIYFVGRACNPTTHNLAIRDIFTKIVASGFELAEVNFSPRLKELMPDLAVDFLAEDGTLIKTFWEYDTGTEGIAELVKKVSRYEPYSSEHLITFVFSTEQRLAQAMKTIRAPYITFAVLSEFDTLQDAAFRSVSGDRNPFF